MHLINTAPYLIPALSFILFALPISGAYREAIRYNELVRELDLRGLPLPIGLGLGITQVEADATLGGNNYLPDANHAGFSGKTITDQSGGGISSSHATTVGRNIYGNSTSIAPGISSIDAYSASDWLNNKGWGSGTPAIEDNPLQNHSWIGDTTSSDFTLRMDFAVQRDTFLPIVGLKNNSTGGDDEIPVIYGSIYNGISVGRSDGNHRTGQTTSADGPGRTKPEIVAPSVTSFATARVTAAAAFLIQSAGSMTNPEDPIRLKAVLLAAANKTPFPGWNQTPERPIDAIYGAGQLDIYEAYFIQQAGPQSPGGSSILPRGWNRTSLSESDSHNYSIEVPAGFTLRNFSALVTWNREITRSGSGIFTIYTPTLANLSLTLRDTSDNSILQQSDSSVDNLEHIWRDTSAELPAGSYSLSVATDIAADYALAWRGELYQDYDLWASSVFTETTTLEQRAPNDDPDNDGIINLLEQAFGGNPELSDPSSFPVSRIVHDEAAGENFLEISFSQPDFNNGLTYTVETVSNLDGTWSSLSSEVELISITPETGGFDRYTYRRTDPVSMHEKAFLRVSVTE